MGRNVIHMHSNISPDGELAPLVMAELCVNSGLKLVKAMGSDYHGKNRP